jgi:hypothetical protein
MSAVEMSTTSSAAGAAVLADALQRDFAAQRAGHQRRPLPRPRPERASS